MSKNNRSGQAAVLTDSDHHRIRKNFNSPHHRLMWDIAQFTGERWGAIIKLKISDVYNNRGEVREEITFRAVTRKASPDGIRETRQVPLHPTLYEILASYKPPAGIWLFPGTDGKHISMQAADAALRRAIAKAKLEGKGISTHSTRRTFITELHKKGCDIYMIQQITGHKDLKALALYIEKDKKRVRSAIALGMKLLLLYHQHLRQTSELIEGRLLLINCESRTIKNTYIATSGLPNNQRYDCLPVRGKGPIPPINSVGIDYYTVATSALHMPNVRGVEGAFYKIDPHEVTVANMQRGDFGVHRDANVPGSSGCIVLRTELGWQAFEKDMQSLASSGCTQVPLLVSYSR